MEKSQLLKLFLSIDKKASELGMKLESINKHLLEYDKSINGPHLQIGDLNKIEDAKIRQLEVFFQYLHARQEVICNWLVSAEIESLNDATTEDEKNSQKVKEIIQETKNEKKEQPKRRGRKPKVVEKIESESEKEDEDENDDKNKDEGEDAEEEEEDAEEEDAEEEDEKPKPKPKAKAKAKVEVKIPVKKNKKTVKKSS